MVMVVVVVMVVMVVIVVVMVMVVMVVVVMNSCTQLLFGAATTKLTLSIDQVQ